MTEIAFPAIEGYGGIHPYPEAGEQPSGNVAYKVVFSVSKESPDGNQANPSLERVARFLNFLAQAGATLHPGDVVAVVHGKATSLVLDEAPYRKRFSSLNPNVELVARLHAAGVQLRVCSQALTRKKIVPEDVNPVIQIDLSALITLATFQLRGYALMPE